MRVPFVDLRAQHASIRGEIAESVARVLDSGTFILGEEVEAFEREFAAYCGTKYCAALNTGTSALHLALLACGIGPGDEVITVPNTFIATCEAISYVGATPVFVDVREDTHLLDVSRLAEAISKRTKAVLPVHLYGQPVDMEPVLEIARREGLVVIEDACQAHGALYRGRRVGAYGSVGCFSYYPSKNLGACGEGGAITTDDEALYRQIRMLRDHGQNSEYSHERVGYNYRMDAIQAALLRAKLLHLDAWNERRRRWAGAYRELLKDAPVTIPVEDANASSVYHLYVIVASFRNELKEYLASRGIATGVHYPVPVHLQPAYSCLGYQRGDFPVAEALAQGVLSLPLFPELTENLVEQICESILCFFRTGRHGQSG